MSSYNGSGTFSISGTGLPYVTATTISSTVANQLNTDLATGLSTAICKDGQTTPTANIPMGGFKLTGLGAATTAGDALRYQDINAGTYTPTGAGVLNVSSITPAKAQWLQVRTVVTVSGLVSVTPTVQSAINFTLTLPVASNLTAVADLAGTGANDADNLAVFIEANIAGHKADCSYVATTLNARTFSYTYTYEVK